MLHPCGGEFPNWKGPLTARAMLTEIQGLWKNLRWPLKQRDPKIKQNPTNKKKQERDSGCWRDADLVADGRTGSQGLRSSPPTAAVSPAAWQPQPCCPAPPPTRRHKDASPSAPALSTSTLYLGWNLCMSPSASSHLLPASYGITALHAHAPVTPAKPFDLQAFAQATPQAEKAPHPAPALPPLPLALRFILRLLCETSLPQQSYLIPEYDAFVLA